MHFLIVDDSPITRGLLETLIKKIVRLSTTSAENGLEALDVYKNLAKTKESIVITIDINMPVMNGIECIKSIRHYEKEKKLSPASIIVISDYDSANAEYLAKLVGANAFLQKPLHRDDLYKTLKRVLGEDNIILMD